MSGRVRFEPSLSHFFLNFYFYPDDTSLHHDTTLEITCSYPPALLFHNPTAKMKCLWFLTFHRDMKGLELTFSTYSLMCGGVSCCRCMSKAKGVKIKSEFKRNRGAWAEERLSTQLWRARAGTEEPRSELARGPEARDWPGTPDCQMGEPVCYPALPIPCSQDDLKQVP